MGYHSSDYMLYGKSNTMLYCTCLYVIHDYVIEDLVSVGDSL